LKSLGKFFYGWKSPHHSIHILEMVHLIEIFSIFIERTPRILLLLFWRRFDWFFCLRGSWRPPSSVRLFFRTLILVVTVAGVGVGCGGHVVVIIEHHFEGFVLLESFLNVSGVVSFPSASATFFTSPMIGASDWYFLSDYFESTFNFREFLIDQFLITV